MALIGAIDDFGDGIVGNFSYIAMAVPAFNFPVNTLTINGFINMVIPSLAVFIDSAAISMFVAHETVVFIGSVGLGPG